MTLEFRIHIPFVESLGLQLLRFENGEAEVAVPPRADLVNHLGILHGGVVMTLLDVAMAHAARSLDADHMAAGPGLVTIEMKTTFMRPGTGRVRAVGRVLRMTSSIAFCEGSSYDEAGELTAHATGTFKLLRRVPEGGRPSRRRDAPAA
jgi:uncharacterized protein (TIGR00369 family)